MKRRATKETTPKLKRKVPFAFLLDELAPLSPHTKLMFGCTAVYLGNKIVFILREREENRDDNGVWVATTAEHHTSLQKDFPSMRSIRLFETEGPTGWQNLPAEADDFEELVLKACAFVRRNDPRIGKIPKSKNPKKRVVKSKPESKAKSPGTKKSKPKKQKRL